MGLLERMTAINNEKEEQKKEVMVNAGQNDSLNIS
jgi:hypothetical protein